MKSNEFWDYCAYECTKHENLLNTIEELELENMALKERVRDLEFLMGEALSGMVIVTETPIFGGNNEANSQGNAGTDCGTEHGCSCGGTC